MLENKLGRLFSALALAVLFTSLIGVGGQNDYETDTNNNRVIDESTWDAAVNTEIYDGNNIEMDSKQGTSLSTDGVRYEGSEGFTIDETFINKMRQDLGYVDESATNYYEYTIYGGISSHNVGEASFEGNETFNVTADELSRFKNDLKNLEVSKDYTYTIDAGFSLSDFNIHYEGREHVTLSYETMLQMQELFIV